MKRTKNSGIIDKDRRWINYKNQQKSIKID